MSFPTVPLDHMARAAFQSERFESALALIATAVEQGQISPDLLLLRAQCHERLGERERAALDYLAVAELLGNVPDALVPVAIQLAHLERHDDELAIYDRALEGDPNHFDALYLKALRLVKLGRHRECLQVIDRAIGVQDDGNAHYTKACAHALLGERDEAIASIRRALSVRPSLRGFIASDSDFETIADDAEFIALTSRPVN